MENIINAKIAYVLRQIERTYLNDKAARDLWNGRLEKLLLWRENFRDLQCQ